MDLRRSSRGDSELCSEIVTSQLTKAKKKKKEDDSVGVLPQAGQYHQAPENSLDILLGPTPLEGAINGSMKNSKLEREVAYVQTSSTPIFSRALEPKTTDLLALALPVSHLASEVEPIGYVERPDLHVKMEAIGDVDGCSC